MHDIEVGGKDRASSEQFQNRKRYGGMHDCNWVWVL